MAAVGLETDSVNRDVNFVSAECLHQSVCDAAMLARHGARKGCHAVHRGADKVQVEGLGADQLGLLEARGLIVGCSKEKTVSNLKEQGSKCGVV